MTVATIDANLLISEIYHTESRRVFATLVRLLGDFDLAEDALQDAFAAAVTQWPRDGVPDNPRAWLVSTPRLPRSLAISMSAWKMNTISMRTMASATIASS